MKYNILRKMDYGWDVWDADLNLHMAGEAMEYYYRIYRKIISNFKIVIA